MRLRLRPTVLIALLLACAAPLAATAPADTAPGGVAGTAPQLLAHRPVAVKPGATLTLEGRGFARNAHVVLLAGPPRRTPTRIGSAVAGSRGRFFATIRIRVHATAAAFVAVACQDACRVKASARFRIVAR